MRSLVVCVTLGVLLVAGGSRGEELPSSMDEALAKVKNAINLLQSGGLGGSLNASQLPIGEAEAAIRRKCEKNGGPDAYDTAKHGTAQLYECAKDLVNVTQLKAEMEAARPTGDLDEVFKKYCRKKPILKGCLLNFTASAEPCLDEQERENKELVHNITEKILNFVCFKEGDRIALFVAAKGPECFQSKAQAMNECAKKVYGNVTSSDGSSGLPFNLALGFAGAPEIKDVPKLGFDQKTCRNMNSLQGCVVEALEKCDDPTPANLFDSIFNYIKKATPCEKVLG